MAINLPIISEWNPAGIDKAINDFKKLETTGQKASFAIKKAAVPAGLALAALGAVAFNAVKAFAEDDAAAQKLATTLGNVTGATDAQVQSVEDFITKTSLAAAIADDELRPALDSLVRGTQDVSKAQKLLNLALDISAGTGKDLGAVSDALSKAFNGNFMALKKLDPALAALIKSGATSDEVFAALGKTFAGQASTAANTTQGRMKSLTIQMDEFKESVGAAVAPILEKLLPAFNKMGDFTRDNTGLVVGFGAVLAVLATTVLAVNAAFKVHAAFLAISAVATNVLTASTYALWAATGVAIIIAIIGALVALQVKFDIFGKTVNLVKAYFTGLWDVARFVFGAIKTGFEGLKDMGGAIFDNVGGAFKTVINAILGFMEAGINKAITGANKALDLADKAAGMFINFGKIPNVSIPRLAEGGITTGPTIAMIGEKGPEAVIPLDRLGSMGGGMNITVNVNGGDPNNIIRLLQQYARNTGPLPVSLQ